MIRKTFIACLALLAVSSAWGQQQGLYSQYMFNLMAINPAYAGNKDAISLNLSHRSQWIGFEGAPITQNFNMHGPLKKQNMAVGFQASHEQIGARSVFGVQGIYSYKIPMRVGQFSFGLQAGIYLYQYKRDKLDYKDINDPILASPDPNMFVPVIDFGVLYSNKTNYIGLTLNQLNNQSHVQNSDSSDSRLYSHVSLIGGKVFTLNRYVALKPSFLVRAAELSAVTFDASMGVFINKTLWLGGSYRYQFGFIGSVQYYINDHFSVGYSYDLPTNPLLTYQSGTHEVYIGYDFSIFRSKIKSPRFF